MPRGFDSLTFNSQYTYVESSSEKVGDFVNQLAGNFSGSAAMLASVNMASCITQRIYSMNSTQKTEGTLLIGAFVTTRHVRTFKKMVYDPLKFRAVKKKIGGRRKRRRRFTDIYRSGDGWCFRRDDPLYPKGRQKQTVPQIGLRSVRFCFCALHVVQHEFGVFSKRCL